MFATCKEVLLSSIGFRRSQLFLSRVNRALVGCPGIQPASVRWFLTRHTLSVPDAPVATKL